MARVSVRSPWRVAVWLVPIAAAAVAAAMLVQAYRPAGVEVEILLPDAADLEMREAPIRYRGVTVGVVTDVRLTADRSAAVVTARVEPGQEAFAREGAAFWLVGPRIALSGVSDVETLLSGAYLRALPGRSDGRPKTRFEALDQPPGRPVAAAEESFVFTLRSPRRGSLTAGAPVFYRGIRVGRVLGARLASDAASVLIDAEVDRRYAVLLREDTRFWNVSGVRAEIGWFGGSVDAGPLESILAGGVEFATPEKPGAVVPAGHVFELVDVPRDSWLEWAPRITVPPPGEVFGVEGVPEAGDGVRAPV